ncbi:right-handed parallel beta-helix repeat-containing protein [Paenibacillus planticolens]|nr:right-handed parallel beta-helix repeat-containing protein [Paenibacillus planticolens]
MEENGATIFRMRDYGVKPDTGEDACEALRTILNMAGGIDDRVIIQFESGRYDFYDTHASKEVYSISRSTSELEDQDHMIHIGIHLKGMSNITIEGNGALLVFHGKMTPFVIDDSRNIEIRQAVIDFERPTVSEMCVDGVHKGAIDFTIHPDSWYAIEQGQLVWVGEGWRSASGSSQVTDPHTSRTWRTNNPVSEATRAEELEPFKVRLHYSARPEAHIGHIYQMRDGICDQAGTLIVQSENIVFDQVHFGYMPGTGMAAHYSEQITLQNLTFAPRQETGRTAASFSDFIRMVNCKGKLIVYHNNFLGSHGGGVSMRGMRWNPQVEIIGNRFASVPERGIRICAGGKAVIQHNAFHRMSMSGILIEEDGDRPFEAGAASEATIAHNYFIKCGDPVIRISTDPVVHNITIEHNFFYLDGTTVVEAQGVQGLVFQANEVVGISPARKPLFNLEACSEVYLTDNAVFLPNQRVRISQMPIEAVSITGDQAMIVEKAKGD